MRRLDWLCRILLFHHVSRQQIGRLNQHDYPDCSSEDYYDHSDWHDTCAVHIQTSRLECAILLW
jgi:hypothetical protein